MNSQRLAQLFNFLKEDPDDPFNLYAIALEYLTQQPREALVYFEKLLQAHENYLATYYHAGKLYADLNEKEKAEKTFLKGINLARKQNNALSLRELQNAYNEMMFEE